MEKMNAKKTVYDCQGVVSMASNKLLSIGLLLINPIEHTISGHDYSGIGLVIEEIAKELREASNQLDQAQMQIKETNQ
jgi:hypothetical protein